MVSLCMRTIPRYGVSYPGHRLDIVHSQRTHYIDLVPLSRAYSIKAGPLAMNRNIEFALIPPTFCFTEQRPPLLP